MSRRDRRNDRRVEKREKKERSDASYTQQRSLHCILAQYPTTAGSTQFCLLCCQPEPFPGSSTARMSQLTLWEPCRLSAWSGRSIHMPCRTYCAPTHSIAPCPEGNRSVATSTDKYRKQMNCSDSINRRKKIECITCMEESCNWKRQYA